MTYHPEDVLPMPLAQLARACRANFADSPSERASLQVDGIWALARHHRVEGLALSGLNALGVDLPDELRAAFARDAKTNAIANLQAVRDTEELHRAFDDDGVDHLFMKGLSLSQLAYGDALLKSGQDIDLLVSPDDLVQAGDTLRRLGYECALPTQSKLDRWHKIHKESIWVREGSLPVELHTRLSDNPKLLSGVTMLSPRQLVEIAPGVKVHTLADQHLLAYLAVHGASSLWFRLKWVCDFAALLHQRTGSNIEEIARGAEELGAGRTFVQAVSLAHSIFGIELGPTLLKAINTPAIRLYRRLALNQLSSNEEPTSKTLGTLRIRLSSLLSKGSVGFIPYEAVRQARAMLLRR